MNPEGGRLSPGGRSALSITLSLEVVDWVTKHAQQAGTARSRVIESLLMEAIRARGRKRERVGGSE